jgi:hypothetical protein
MLKGEKLATKKYFRNRFITKGETIDAKQAGC